MRGAWVTGASWHDTTRAARGALAGVADPSGAIPGPMVAGLCEAGTLAAHGDARLCAKSYAHNAFSP